MGRSRRGVPVHGWIAIDKPLGVTSTAVVAKVRRATNAAKVGHGGTLDPLASGILPIALGEATKTVSYVMDGRKTYRWKVRWGEARNTDDAEGQVIATSDVRPDEAAILAALPAFTGWIEQVPPAFSAIKIDGQRAYDLARADQPVEIQSRQVRIDRFSLVSLTPDEAEFEVETGKGAYIRSLARDLAIALGTVGYVSALRRTQCGPFDETNAISLDLLAEFGHSAPSAIPVLPVETVLDDIPALALTEAEVRRLRLGQPVPVTELADQERASRLSDGETVRAMQGDQVAALARIDGAELRPVRVFNLQPL